jgi:transposase-like protein
LKASWQVEYETWQGRSLADLEVVYLWADGLYVKAGIDDGKAALLVVIGALSDGRKVVLAVASGQRESTASWAAVLRDLKARGLVAPRLTIADGHLGIWGALAEIYPASAEQRCWNHKMMKVLDQVPRKEQAKVKAWLRKMMYAETRAACEAALRGRVPATLSQGGRDPRARLGAHGHLLRLPRRALAAPADDQHRRVPLRRRAAAHDGRQAL